MTLSFDYYSKDYEPIDLIEYGVLLDNTSSFDANLTGLEKNTLGWTTVNTVIPDGTSFIRLRIQAYQNGSSDFLGIDNIKLTAVDTTLSIDSLNKKNEINIYPNLSNN